MKRILLAVVVLLAACSGGGAGSGDGGAPTGGGTCTSANTNTGCFGSCNACTILTPAQVTAVVGAQIVDPGSGDGDPHTCDWLHNDATGIPDLQVIAYVNITAKGFEDSCHPRTIVADSGISVTPVSGVGDDACYIQLQGLGGPVLNFLKGCWSYSISVLGGAGGSPFSDAMIEADEKMLALDALPKL